MTGLELNKLLNEALAKYGLSVELVTESQPLQLLLKSIWMVQPSQNQQVD